MEICRSMIGAISDWRLEVSKIRALLVVLKDLDPIIFIVVGEMDFNFRL